MNDPDRMLSVHASFAANRAASIPRSICGVSAGILGVSAACLTLMNGTNSAPVCASDNRAAKLDDLQHSLGEGPCPEAYIGRSAVYEPDLQQQNPIRWQHFTPSAIELGTGGVFAFPLQVGENCLGVLTIYQDTAGHLSEAQESDGRIVADTLARSMLRVLPEGDFEVLAGTTGGHGSHRAEFHQASGMTAIQLGIDVSEAAVRIRAHAFGADRTVAEVAREIVDRKLRLDNDRHGTA